jgi:hypothetical protein
MEGIGKNYLDLVDKETMQPIAPQTPVAPIVAEETPVVEPVVKAEETTTVETPVAEKQVVNTTEPIIEDVYDDQKILSYFEKKGKKLESIDDLFKTPEKTEDPYANVSDEIKEFLNYNKDTGRGIEDWNALNKDFTKIPAIDIAREKAIANSNGKLTKANVDQYLEKKLNIDLEDLQEFDDIDIEAYGKDYLDQKINDQQKYRQPKDKQPQKDVVTLENGMQMSKAEYDKQNAIHQEYLANVKGAVDSIATASFKVKIDDNGTEKVLELDYEYNKEDRHNMVSSSANIDATFTRLFSTKDGGTNYKELNEGLFYADKNNREKMVSSIVHKALAKQAEDFAALEHNFNFGQKKLPNSGRPTNAGIPFAGNKNDFGVKYSIEQFKQN